MLFVSFELGELEGVKEEPKNIFSTYGVGSDGGGHCLDLGDGDGDGLGLRVVRRFVVDGS